MAMIDPSAWRARQACWRRFERWSPPESDAERGSRIAWLDEVTELARARGRLDEPPIDSPRIRARRRRIREGLARIRG